MNNNKKETIVIGIAGGTGSTVKLMHEQFVEPSKKNVDIIVPRGKM